MYEITLKIVPNEGDKSPEGWDFQSLLDLVEPVEIVECKLVTEVTKH
jgi:hypothetical protein